jgi:hypothetical protein
VIAEHHNELTPAEAERLALLLEELGEAQQVIGKILRHGYESHNPYDSGQTTNRMLLTREIGDVGVALEIMARAGDIIIDAVSEHKISKMKRVGKYLHHNRVEE